MLRDSIQELRELGVRRSLFRLGWELRTRTGLAGWTEAEMSAENSARLSAEGRIWAGRLPFATPESVAECLRDLIPAARIDDLRREAFAALGGRLRCFGLWEADFGNPIDWYRNPVTGRRREPALAWSRALGEEPPDDDVKMVWEAGRFPHAWAIARAAAFDPDSCEVLANGLLGQMDEFAEAAPASRGIHWASGQEIAFRFVSWVFAASTLLSRGSTRERAAALLARAAEGSLVHVERVIDYARLAVYNNHLLSEALLLYAATGLGFGGEMRRRVGDAARATLRKEAGRQFYVDGAYIQLSHNYHRVAAQDLLFACAFARAQGEPVDEAWTSALGRSVDFLLQHQNPEDGRLPNYGANDGALPGILSTCDFSDFRPTLQAASLASRGERLYEPGPWDEEAAWLLGPEVLDAKMTKARRHSVSFGATGFHVLRSEKDEGTFATLRCGTIRDRFSQIDMLHLDLFWEGENVIVDGGSYLYNGPKEWHDHFVETGSHNTVTIDGRDQMKHFRKFKCLYWTEAKLLDFRRVGQVAFAAGEHYGYRRHPGACVHRRSVALRDDGAGIVVDTVQGEGRHRVRLHWLFGDFPHEFDSGRGNLILSTPRGRFGLAALGDVPGGAVVTLARGEESPPRGWYSRYYGEKVAVPSFAAELEAELPVRFVTGFGPGDVEVVRRVAGVAVRTEAGDFELRLKADGLLCPA